MNLKVLARQRDNITCAAEELGISSPTMYELIEKVGIARKQKSLLGLVSHGEGFGALQCKNMVLMKLALSSSRGQGRIREKGRLRTFCCFKGSHEPSGHDEASYSAKHKGQSQDGSAL